MMFDDVSTINTLRNNAKTVGGVIGTEMAFFENKQYNNDPNEFFMEKELLEFQNITFDKIEKTNLGKSLKSNIQKLESRAKGL